MSKYICTMCGFIYNEEKGIPEHGIAPGTKFSDLPDDWVCPLCGSPKSMFEKMKDDDVSAGKVEEPAKKTKAQNNAVAAEIPSGEGEDRMREMSFGEMADMCSNLQRGCEKQHLAEEAGLFGELSDYYRSKIEPAKEATDAKLLDLINENLAKYDDANAAAADVNDRGAKRVLLWSSKVMNILKALMDRYGAEGKKFIESTNVYVCDICGFVYVGDNPPAICPICKVPSLKLIKVERRQ